MTMLLKLCRLESFHDGSGFDTMTPESGPTIHNRREIGIS